MIANVRAGMRRMVTTISALITIVRILLDHFNSVPILVHEPTVVFLEPAHVHE